MDHSCQTNLKIRAFNFHPYQGLGDVEAHFGAPMNPSKLKVMQHIQLKKKLSQIQQNKSRKKDPTVNLHVYVNTGQLLCCKE